MIRLIGQSKDRDAPFFILHTTPLPHIPLQAKPDTSHLYKNVSEPRRTYLRMCWVKLSAKLLLYLVRTVFI